MCFNNPGIKLEPALRGYEEKIEHLSSYAHRRPHNCKTSHFTSWKERERLQNVKKLRVHVQSVQNYLHSLSNMQI